MTGIIKEPKIFMRINGANAGNKTAERNPSTHIWYRKIQFYMLDI
ncbi:hypothetical protein ERIC1_1c24330 [Paenibacillus larvae subsp. larvae DSM 25719]|uniref:Uncharacterized protein n=1 Tax=Paenibacillus larvae subsp. larvae DSM 25430 TaxID=697284 RepID=V9WEX2_9BACL|nr:hypothetical protein ERIC2_c40091 [Paenibacillus larvae subsp. larvae DSM 25430]ETK28937.1 hypothetical protein ERIC1_1c24330 [Paenibacillus larvae subsp. larvae DSM 25719]